MPKYRLQRREAGIRRWRLQKYHTLFGGYWDTTAHFWTRQGAERWLRREERRIQRARQRNGWKTVTKEDSDEAGAS